MNTSTLMRNEIRAPFWLKITAAIGIVWYAFGLLQFWLAHSMDTTESVASDAITAAHGAAIDNTPILIWLAFAIASSAGLVGAILLFSKSAKANVAFGLSLVSAAIYYSWVYGISGTAGDRPTEEIIIAAVVGVVTLAFFFLSRRVTR